MYAEDGIMALPKDLPEAQVMITAAKAVMSQVKPLTGESPEATRERRHEAADAVLNQWAPSIDALTDINGAAEFLGLKGADSLRRARWRKRADGTPGWPEPDEEFSAGPSANATRSVPTWRLRTIVLHRAEAPGRGHPGYTGNRDWDRTPLRGRGRQGDGQPPALLGHPDVS
jgi:hypothetical protein